MEKSIIRHIEDEKFIFDHRRVMYWPRKKILIAADLHWGKTHFLRSHGVAVSDKVFDEDLKILSQLLHDYETDTLLVLGDLIHHEKSLNQDLVEKISWFRHEHPVELLLIKGNHDKYTAFPESWGIVEEDDFYLERFSFSHDYNPKTPNYQFTGHTHPMMRIKGGNDELRFPAFIIRSSNCLLPAFGKLTGGKDIKLEKGDEALLIMPEGLSGLKK